MTRSMTGYGRAEYLNSNGAFIVEIRSLNHKFFDVSVRLPETLNTLEEKIKAEIKQHIKRGKLTASITFKPSDRLIGESIKCDIPAIKRVHAQLSQAKKSLKFKDEITLSDVLSFSSNLISYSRPSFNSQKIWASLKTTLNKALAELIKMRDQEGKALEKDILARSRMMEEKVSAIEHRSDVVTKAYKARLIRRIKELIGPKTLKLDEVRLETECALLARNSDISEEIVRLKSHLKALQDLIKKGKEIGRQIDFIAQEMTREINTICQKANDYTISKDGISIKGAIEKIREQAQNVE